MPESETDLKGETITLHELLEQSARAALDLQREDGSFPPGRNGIYDEPETPVRTTSHWLTTLSKVYEITGKEVFADAANDAVDYLLSDEARPYRYTFHSRNAEGKDKCDGLVGQAAPIRGLALAGSAFKRPELFETPEDVFSLHPFDTHLGLWQRVEIDGTNLSFDRTLNHQIIFAAAATSLIDDSKRVKHRIEMFLDSLGDNMRTHPDGVVRHYVRPPLATVLRVADKSLSHWSLLWNEFAARYHAQSYEFRKKELGYQLTILAALARIKRCFPHHNIWDHSRIQSALDFIQTSDYERQIRKQKSNYGSMTPGINYAQVLTTFKDPSAREIRPWVEQEIDRKYDPETKLLTQETSDPMFQASVVGSLSNLPNIQIKVASS